MEKFFARTISEVEAKVKLERIHDSTCADNHISLYKRNNRKALFAKHGQYAASVQQNCPKCQEMIDVTEALFIQEVGDWRQPYLDYLQHRLLLSNHTDAAKIQKKSLKYLSTKEHYSKEDLTRRLSGT